MKTLLTIALVALLAAPVLALDLGAARPAKPHQSHPQNVPSDVRQGGETIADAVPLSLPVVDLVGTTAGYLGDYDEMCPYGGEAPDVVYTFTPDADLSLDIDLCGSSYDTKVYVYDVELNLIACNDDYYFDDDCGVYTSKIAAMPVVASVQYFVVVDGYGQAFGDYLLNIDVEVPCVLDCPAGAELEGEPPLQDGYVDLYNSGCGAPDPADAFGTITQDVFCGVSGWYQASSGSQYRDTDWFELTVPDAGFVEIQGDAEFATNMFELGPQECSDVGVIQTVSIGPCSQETIVIPGEPGSPVWFWVGPSVFEGAESYEYVLYTNLVTATERHSWTDVKGLFD